MAREPYIEMWQSSKNLRWYFHKKAANGKIVGDGGQGYARKDGAVRAIRREHPGLTIHARAGANRWWQH